MRQKAPELLQAVQHLAKNETEAGIALLSEQGRVTQVKNATERVAAIARDYAAKPENTLIVSPDNRSRQQINAAVRGELKAKGTLSPGSVLQYNTGSKAEGIERGSFATVIGTDKSRNTVTVRKEDGQTVTYDPKRLRGVTAYRETAKELRLASASSSLRQP